MTDTQPPKAAATGSLPRWEDVFYNSYGNYNGFRFQDFQDRCQKLVKHNGWWECSHAERDTDFNGHCCLDGCPSVEVNGCQEEDYEAWGDNEIPVIVLDVELAALLAKRWSPAVNAERCGPAAEDSAT